MAGCDELIGLSAVALVDQLRSGTITPHDLLDAIEARIAIVDPSVNALPILCFGRAREHADRLLRLPVAQRGRLAGMPVPIKDLTPVAGVRTTQGSPIFADVVASASDVLVERLEAEGGIVYAKSNTPEFGAGGNTFNDVFGPTLNPYDTSRSAAGSSGGAAVALATGMAWLAHGSDLGGSLRNPASFCGIVGMRPTPGRVAQSRALCVDGTLGVQGPMARTVEDLALCSTRWRVTIRVILSRSRARVRVSCRARGRAGGRPGSPIPPTSALRPSTRRSPRSRAAPRCPLLPPA